MKKIVIGLMALVFGITSNMKAQLNNGHLQGLDARQKKIVTIAAYTSRGELDKLKVQLNEGLDAGLTINQIKEILVHLYAYSGFPRSLRGLQTFMTVLDERKTQGINDMIGPEASPIIDIRDKYTRGKEILADLAGIPAPEGRPTTGYAAFSPEIETFLKEHLFTDIFERDVLTYAQREMVTVSILIAIGGVEPMMHSHMNLALNVGISAEQLEEIIQIIGEKVSKKEAYAAEPVLSELIRSRGLGLKPLAIAQQLNRIFPIGEEINNDNFSGRAWNQRLVTDKENFDVTVGNVIFEPGVRNSWHSHPGGQILLCLSGKGYYQERGKPIQLHNVGDVVEILPNVVHWHGATPNSSFEHIAIGTQQNKGSVIWYEPVSDEIYNNYGQ